MPRKLRVEFRTEDAFRREYAQNISNGGIFIATKRTLELRQIVTVELAIAPLSESIELEGEVVHCIPPELASTGARPGVAIQFLCETAELQKRLKPISAWLPREHDERQGGGGRRRALRSRARVAVKVKIDGRWLDGHTRNISSSGALLIVDGAPPPVGTQLGLKIPHPTSGEQMKVRGVVMRHVEGAGGTCLGVEFQVPEARQPSVTAFVKRLRAAERNRKLGGINGPIAELGVLSVLRMFGSCAPQGMLTLMHGEEEGYIAISDGALRAVLGRLEGGEALSAMSDWTEGSFEFETNIDEGLFSGPALPLSEVVPDLGTEPAPAMPSPALASEEDGDDDWDDIGEFVEDDDEEFVVEKGAGEASASSPEDEIDVEIDFGGLDLEGEEPSEEGFSEASLGKDFGSISPDATLVRCAGDGDGEERDKIQQALLDLAAVGVTVAKAVDIIPESDAEVYDALAELIDEGLIALD